MDKFFAAFLAAAALASLAGCSTSASSPDGGQGSERKSDANELFLDRANDQIHGNGASAFDVPQPLDIPESPQSNPAR
jgi:hypothetical protein